MVVVLWLVARPAVVMLTATGRGTVRAVGEFSGDAGFDDNFGEVNAGTASWRFGRRRVARIVMVVAREKALVLVFVD